MRKKREEETCPQNTVGIQLVSMVSYQDKAAEEKNGVLGCKKKKKNSFQRLSLREKKKERNKMFCYNVEAKEDLTEEGEKQF